MDNDCLPLYPAEYPQTQVMQKDIPMNHQLSYPGPQRQQQQQALQQQTQVVLLGPENTVTTCPFCNASIKTAVKYTTNTRTHMAAALCCLACCCCCIPYSSDSAKNADHYCPNCQRYIGTYFK